jgi:glycosyltransferase involved in cell wall biosynthesis
MRSVLMLSYRFAPQGGAGSLRAVKFVKYLPSFGWRPIVHTVSNPHWHVWDHALSREVPKDVTVYRSRTIEPESAGEQAGEQVLSAAARKLPRGFVARLRRSLGGLRRWLRVWVLIPDKQAAWIPGAIIRTLILVRRHRPAVLYTSSPPHSVQLVGLVVKRLTGLPWVVDFRDLWLQSIHRSELYRRRWRRRIETALERAVARHADRLITTTEPNREELISKYGGAEKVVVIPNGYDHADFEGPLHRPADVDPTCFNLTMTGQVEKLIDMKPFFRALALAGTRKPALAAQMRVRLIGTDPKPYAELIRELGLEAQVHYLGYMPHEEALGYVRTSSAFFLSQIPHRISAGTKLSVKLFEYFAARRRILALTTPDSITAELLAEGGVGVQIAPDDVEAIATAVLDLFHSWQSGRSETKPDPSFLERFERKHLTERLAGVFEDALATPSERRTRSQPAAARSRRAA